MTYLKFYVLERNEFHRECSIFLSPLDVIKTINKLTRHYKLPKLVIRFNKRNKGSGSFIRYRYWMNEVWFYKSGSSLELVVHEVAHHYQHTKTGKTRHSKKLMSIIRRMIKYCRKKDYWGLESNKAGDMIK